MNTAFTQVSKHLRWAGGIGRRPRSERVQHSTAKAILDNSHYLSPDMEAQGWLFEYNGFTAQLCCTPESRELAYRLRYRAYRHAHAIPPSTDRLLKDKFDDQPNTRTHLIWYKEKPVASVRSSIWSKRYGQLPTESTTVFRKEVARYIGMHSSFLESSHFVTDPDLDSRESFYAQIMLYRMQDLSSRYDACPTIITAVQERHVTFYQRVLGFRQISMPKVLDWIDYNLVLLRAPMDESREMAAKRGMPDCTREECDRYTSVCDALISSATE